MNVSGEITANGALSGESVRRKPLSLTAVMGISAASCVGFILYLRLGLHYDFMRSDVLGYWQMSLNPLEPFNTWYLPAYPWLIALGRFLFAGLLPPAAIMQSITVGFLLASVAAIYLLARELGSAAPDRWALLFSWYPFVGLTYGTDPIADSMTLGLLVLVVYFLHRKAWVGFALSCAVLLLTHKASWFFALPLCAYSFVRYREARLAVLLAGVPLALFLGVGAVVYNDPFWFSRWSVNNLLTARNALPVFDGIVGPLAGGSLAKMTKGVVVLLTAVMAAVLLFACWKRRYWPGIAVAAALLTMAAVVNAYEIWALVRFSKLAVVPIMVIMVERPSRAHTDTEREFSPSNIVLLGCLLSNAAFGYYLAKVFFS